MYTEIPIYKRHNERLLIPHPRRPLVHVDWNALGVTGLLLLLLVLLMMLGLTESMLLDIEMAIPDDPPPPPGLVDPVGDEFGGPTDPGIDLLILGLNVSLTNGCCDC